MSNQPKLRNLTSDGIYIVKNQGRNRPDKDNGQGNGLYRRGYKQPT